jgi:hypothetical protein
MRTRDRSLRDPLTGHGRVALDRYGVPGTRQQDDDIRVALEQFGQVPAKAIPRVTGPVTDPTVYEALAVLQRQGHLVNETDLSPDPLPGAYYGNAGIKFVGVAPTLTGPAAGAYLTTVVGSGFSIGLNDATDNSGRITLTTGTGVSAAGNIVLVTFNRPKGNADYRVWIWAEDADASTAAGRSAYSNFGDRTTTDWILACSSALASSTSYHFGYGVFEVEAL